MAKDRDLLDKATIEKLINKKGDYYVCISRGRFEHIVTSIINAYRFSDKWEDVNDKTSGEEIEKIEEEENSIKKGMLSELEKICKKMLKKKEFYALYDRAIEELSTQNLVSGKIPKINNTEQLLQYLSSINDNIVKIFKLLRSCRDIKSNSKIIDWMKNNKLICASANLLTKKNLANLKKAIAECNKPGDADSAIDILETMESNRKIILEYLQTTLTKQSDDAKALKKIEMACLEDKVESLEEKLKQKTEELSEKFSYREWIKECKNMDSNFFETARKKLGENMEDEFDFEFGYRFNPARLKILNIKPDFDGFDFSKGPIGALLRLNDSVWHRVYKGGSTAASRGWKIHISPILTKCTEVFGLVVEVWQKLKFDFKFQGALPLYRAVNKIKSGEDISKEKKVSEEIGKLSQEGKFIAIYPKNDSHAAEIVEQLNAKFKKAGLSKSDFLKIRFDFGIYPGIYARLCHYGDKDGDSGRNKFYINKKTLEKHAKAQGKKMSDYEHPFKYLFMGGKPLPKGVMDILKIIGKEVATQPLNSEKLKLDYRKDLAKKKIKDTEFMINNW